MFKHFRSYFVSGLVTLAPLFLTVLVLFYLVRLADAFVVNPVFRLLPFTFDAPSRALAAKVIIALAVAVFITLLGLAAQKFLFRKILESGEAVILTIPVFNRVYRSFKEISQAIFGDKSGIFKRVVFVEYPRKGVYALGFVTQEKEWKMTETPESLLSVFIPNPPNPTTGNVILAPRKDTVETDMSIEEGIRFCISGGAVVPPRR